MLVVATVALVAVLSYAGQRLWDARVEPPLGSVLVQATIPYYWRAAGAVVQGVVVGTLVGFGLGPRGVRWGLARLPSLVLLVVLPAAISMVLVP